MKNMMRIIDKSLAINKSKILDLGNILSQETF